MLQKGPHRSEIEDACAVCHLNWGNKLRLVSIAASILDF